MNISLAEAEQILMELYGFESRLFRIPGDEDLNFRFTADEQKFILKISKGNKDAAYFDFQTQILLHLKEGMAIEIPVPIPAKSGKYFEKVEVNSTFYWVRVVGWVEGKLWSDIKFYTENHYKSLGRTLGFYNLGLASFDHPYAHRILEWDLARADWIGNHFDIFSDEEKIYISFFYNKFILLKDKLHRLRKAVVHNDGNDNNVLVDRDGVVSIIDFGDSVHTQIINDLAIGVTYALMDAQDLLDVTRLVVKGFHETFPLTEEEIECIYGLVGARLIISLTKSRQNFLKNPENDYHQISAASGWKLIRKWKEISETLITYLLKADCGYDPLKKSERITKYLSGHRIKIEEFIGLPEIHAGHISFDVESTILGLPESYLDPRQHQRIIDEYSRDYGFNLIYGGYLECRPFYATEGFRKCSVDGVKSRTIHLGEDYWVPAGTPIYTPLYGRVVLLKNNDINKDYGPTMVLEHYTDHGEVFYTLYGHLDPECLKRWSIGDVVGRGSILAYVGNFPDNGNWAPHLHFQIILDLLGEKDNFPGVAFADEAEVWSHICPDPKRLIDLPEYPEEDLIDAAQLKVKRERITSKALSLSYDNPLHIVRGDGVFLIDKQGQRYLDLVNNVAHVGHENPEVVKAGQKQMAVLNTNSRYLHRELLRYAEKLLGKFSNKFSKVFFVNSGSEANDLALRIARTISGNQNVLALRHGYHGHTQATLDVGSYKFEGKGGLGRPDHTYLIDLDNIGSSQQLESDIIGVSSLAGFISESILSCAGQVVPDRKTMQEIYHHVTKKGGINIADEVQTGFGRVGSHYWAFELHGLDPDIVTVGKPMGNGHPIGALICKGETIEKFENGMEFFSTYGGNPVSCAIGSKVMDVIENQGLQNHALELGNYFKSSLRKLAENHECIYDVRGEGLFLGIEFRKNGNPDPDTCHWIVNALKNKKILLSTDGPYHNVIKIKPPMVISKKDVDYFLTYFESILKSWY